MSKVNAQAPVFQLASFDCANSLVRALEVSPYSFIVLRRRAISVSHLRCHFRMPEQIGSPIGMPGGESRANTFDSVAALRGRAPFVRLTDGKLPILRNEVPRYANDCGL